MSSTTIAAGAALAITGHAFLDPEEQQPARRRLPSADRQTKVPPSSPQTPAPDHAKRFGTPPLARTLTFFD